MPQVKEGYALGVTGTRVGMTREQEVRLREFLLDKPPATLLHGACVGVDEEVALLVREQMGEDCHIVAWPGMSSRMGGGGPNHDSLSHRAMEVSDEVMDQRTHFARNREIVSRCSLLLVVPREMSRQPRGGTWYTYDYADKVGRAIMILWPDGTTSTYSEESH